MRKLKVKKIMKDKKQIFTVAVLTVLVGLITFQAASIGVKASRTVTTSATDWGMSYQVQGEPPVGNATYEYLEKFDSRFYEKTDKKYVYLTFDAGYENGYTSAILDVLKETGVKAAFFVVGNYIKSEPELVKRMYDEGHLVVNHTMDHPDTTKLSHTQFNEQITELEELYESVTGAKMEKYYRPPSGIFNESTLTYAKELGYKTIFWSIAYVDWKNDAQPTPSDALETLNSRTHNGAIILLHSTSKTNSEILSEYINNLKQEGYSFKELTELKF